MDDLIMEFSTFYRDALKKTGSIALAKKMYNLEFPEISRLMRLEMMRRQSLDERTDDTELGNKYIAAAREITREFNSNSSVHNEQDAKNMDKNKQLDDIVAQVEALTKLIANLKSQPEPEPEPEPEWRNKYVSYSLNGRKENPGEKNGYRINVREM